MHYGNIKYNDIANGEGVRTTLFVSGCRQHCKNCFNPETWSFEYGNSFDEEVQEKIIKSLKLGHIKGLSILGGEPMEPENQEGILPFVKKVKENCPDKTIWIYTGYVLDKDLVPGGRKYTDFTDEILDRIDILVDGPFVEELKDITLKFRGSSNQRILDMNNR
jgi:anaerobic ribonucleoside-triphosphate reductase activating protein